MVDVSTLHPRGSRFNSCYHKIMRRRGRGEEGKGGGRRGGGGERKGKGEREGRGKREGGGESFQILIFFNFLTRG